MPLATSVHFDAESVYEAPIVVGIVWDFNHGLFSMTEAKPMTQSSAVETAVSVADLPEPMPEALQPGGAPTLSDEDFRAIYEAQFDYVWHTLRRLGTHDRDIEDLTHDVFVAFYRSSFDSARPVKPWLFGIAFRVASDYRRRAQHRNEIPEDHPRDHADGSPAADEQVATQERRRLVAGALEALNGDRRAVFVMHEIDGLSMPEIAAVLGAPLNTLYSRLRLAREQFAVAVRRASRREEVPT